MILNPLDEHLQQLILNSWDDDLHQLILEFSDYERGYYQEHCMHHHPNKEIGKKLLGWKKNTYFTHSRRI